MANEIRNHDGTLLATYCEAADEAAAELIATPVHDEGRSPFHWFVLPNGDVILGVFPQGETYMKFENRVSADFRRDT